MSNAIQDWVEKICQRYENYLRTSFFFKNPELRNSFQTALKEEGSLLKGPFPEQSHNFEQGMTAQALALECFPDKSDNLLPALIDKNLFTHQEKAIRAVHLDNLNIVAATGTASGKTESFLYPILFELYQQHLAGELDKHGVRAMILYPMNALANDQRERLGKICEKLKESQSGFSFTFGQYTGQTPKNDKDNYRNAATRLEERRPGELVFRDEMRETPPHILLTNYSMLEYLLIRPDDSPLFDNDMGKHWQFIVLDEAHQYRGAKGMEMGMLIRRLKQRLRDGGRQDQFRCIATSATLSSDEDDKNKQVVAKFAEKLFGENFSPDGIIFGSKQRKEDGSQRIQRYHAFLRALEGAFLVHKNGEDVVVLNRKGESKDGTKALPLEIALCRECGQHYYVGQEREGRLEEAIRDPSDPDFEVNYYMPLNDNEDIDDEHRLLCRGCGSLSKSETECSCNATISVKKCKSHEDHADQLEKCEACNYRRGSVGDPVQEIVHGTDGPNAVIATAMHELLPEDKCKVLAFADSRQEAAFFAWYAEDSYKKLRDRNFILRAMKASPVDKEGLSIDDLKTRLLQQYKQADLFIASETNEQNNQQVLTSILREALTDERRLSLSGVGLVKWLVKIPDELTIPEIMLQPPWNFTREEALCLIAYLLDDLRLHHAMNLPEGAGTPVWDSVSNWQQRAYLTGKPGGRKDISEWGNPQSAVVKHFLHRILEGSDLPVEEFKEKSIKLMKAVWDKLREVKNTPILSPGKMNGTFRLNPNWLRIKPAGLDDIWECNTCANLNTHNIRDICSRNGCPGYLARAKEERFRENHYRIIYESKTLRPAFKAEEHTAQIDTEKARKRQQEFKDGSIHLLSSSTTFEVGVDLGDLEVVFLRNVPPESFSYVQRVGRAGRRDTPGLALTYCRRNPHDLYHYEKPEERIIRGEIQPPCLFMTNKKIILRHMVATVLSSFFRENKARFIKLESFIENWAKPRMVIDVRRHCEESGDLKDCLLKIVPKCMYGETGLEDRTWIESLVGDKSHFADSEAEVCADYNGMEKLRLKCFEQRKDTDRITRRMDTIAKE
ncbi:MAG: DEAD/DEAH box helicase, partial [Pseudomonadota bacterium]|nr:DEAD/DEAH box helicase [Pseudomonadota bacterium]